MVERHSQRAMQRKIRWASVGGRCFLIGNVEVSGRRKLHSTRWSVEGNEHKGDRDVVELGTFVPTACRRLPRGTSVDYRPHLQSARPVLQSGML
jgi:hypothetical protein